MDLKDLAGISEPLKRLIEVVSKGIGKVFMPYFVKKQADAKAYEIKRIAVAIGEASREQALPIVYKSEGIEICSNQDAVAPANIEHALEERYLSRIKHQELKKQKNIEQITQIAANNIEEVIEIPDNSPEDDWISRFFDYAQDISSIEMQELWGRILSGEIKRPGSYSLRTLDAVRNLSKDDAELFEKMAKAAFKSDNLWFIPAFEKEYLRTKFGLIPSNLFGQSEIGFMYPTELVLKLFHEESQSVFTTDSKIIIVNKYKCPNAIQIPIWKYTKIGSEIINLIKNQIDDQYYTKIAEYFKSQKCEVIIGNIVKYLADGQIEYTEETRYKDLSEEG